MAAIPVQGCPVFHDKVPAIFSGQAIGCEDFGRIRVCHLIGRGPACRLGLAGGAIIHRQYSMDFMEIHVRVSWRVTL